MDDDKSGPIRERDHKGESQLIAHALRADGFDASEDGTGRGTPLVPVALAENQRGELREMDVMPSLNIGGGKPGRWYPAVAYQCHGSNVGPMGSIRAGNGNEAGGVPFVVHPLQESSNEERDIRRTMEIGGKRDGCERSQGGIRLREDRSQDGPTGEEPFAFQTRIARNGRGQPKGVIDALMSSEGGTHADSKPHVVIPGMAVRRLTPRECERLQGFPDDWTLITHRGKPAADGPRYKALGNSIAVPVLRWIGRRILEADSLE